MKLRILNTTLSICLTMITLFMCFPASVSAKDKQLLQLSKYFFFDGSRDPNGLPQGKGTLELVYYLNNGNGVLRSDGKEVKKDVLEGVFNHKTVTEAILKLERYNGPLWINSGIFKGVIEYEFSSDKSSIIYTLKHGIYEDSQLIKTIITPDKPLVIERQPYDYGCYTRIIGNGYSLNQKYELVKIEERESKSKISIQTFTQPTNNHEKSFQHQSYNSPSYCNSIVAWVNRHKDSQTYQMNAAQVITYKESLWRKNGDSFNSKSFKRRSRFTAARGFREDYSDPHQGLLHSSEGTFSFNITKSIFKYKIKDQIQIECEERNGKAVRPKDGATESFGCKDGTRTGIRIIRLFGGDIKLKYTITCSHKTYQTTRFTTYQGGTSTNIKGVGFDEAINRGVTPSGRKVMRSDDYAPWRQVHEQTTTFNFDELARINKISKKELVIRMILTSDWDVPMIISQSHSSYDVPWGNIDLKNGENIDHAVFIYFLWKQFNITENDLTQYIDQYEDKEKQEKLEREEKEKQARYNQYVLSIDSATMLIDAAQQLFTSRDPKGNDVYGNSIKIFRSTLKGCQMDNFMELTDKISNILQKHAPIQIYYASNGIIAPNYNLSECVKSLKDNPPSGGLINFLVMCRENGIKQKQYLQAFELTKELAPIISNSTIVDKESLEYDNNMKAVHTLLNTGNYEKAISLAQQLVTKYSSVIWPKDLLCYVYAYLVDKKNAMEIWKKSLLAYDKKYASKHPDSQAYNLMKQFGWIK